MNAPAAPSTTSPGLTPTEAAELRRKARACLDLAASSTHPAERDSATTAADRLSARLISAGLPGIKGTPSEAARTAQKAAGRRRAPRPAADPPPPEAGVLARVERVRAVKQPGTPRGPTCRSRPNRRAPYGHGKPEPSPLSVRPWGARSRPKARPPHALCASSSRPSWAPGSRSSSPSLPASARSRAFTSSSPPRAKSWCASSARPSKPSSRTPAS
jgi:hypothetical protein